MHEPPSKTQHPNQNEMKRLLTAIALLGATFATQAQGVITMTTEAETGTDIKMQVNVTSATIPVMVDFGDGNFKPHTIDPTAWAGHRQISGTVLGPTLRIKGNLTELQGWRMRFNFP